SVEPRKCASVVLSVKRSVRCLFQSGISYRWRWRQILVAVFTEDSFLLDLLRAERAFLHRALLSSDLRPCVMVVDVSTLRSDAIAFTRLTLSVGIRLHEAAVNQH